jgi:hypothetical protein
MEFGDLRDASMLNKLCSGRNGKITELERPDGAGLMIKHRLKSLCDDILNDHPLDDTSPWGGCCVQRGERHERECEEGWEIVFHGQ